jgi:hypothetical protein
MTSHARVQAAMSAVRDGEASARVERFVRRHLATCVACRAVADADAAIDARARRLVPSGTAPWLDDLQRRIAQEPRPGRARRVRLRRVVPVLVAAVTLAAVLAPAVWVRVHQQERVQPVGPAVTTTVRPLGSAGAAIAAARAYQAALSDDNPDPWMMLTPAARADWGGRRRFTDSRMAADMAEGLASRADPRIPARAVPLPSAPGHWLVVFSGTVMSEGIPYREAFVVTVDLTPGRSGIMDTGRTAPLAPEDDSTLAGNRLSAALPKDAGPVRAWIVVDDGPPIPATVGTGAITLVPDPPLERGEHTWAVVAVFPDGVLTADATIQRVP